MSEASDIESRAAKVFRLELGYLALGVLGTMAVLMIGLCAWIAKSTINEVANLRQAVTALDTRVAIVETKMSYMASSRPRSAAPESNGNASASAGTAQPRN